MLHKGVQFGKQGCGSFFQRLARYAPHKYAKFVAAKAAHGIGIAEYALKCLAGSQQGRVAFDMAKGVVDKFKIIQIKK